MGQTSGMEDWDRAARASASCATAPTSSPRASTTGRRPRLTPTRPTLEVSDDPDAWHPDDALMVPLRSADGALLGIVSVDEPVTGRRPTSLELDLLSTVVANAAIAVEQAQTAEAWAAATRAAVENPLAVSAQLTERRTAEEVLDAVCWGVREALGFHKVVAFLADEGKLVPLSGVGFTPERAAEFPHVPVDAVGAGRSSRILLRHGCIVMERDEALKLTPGVRRRLLVRQQRPRAARLGPPLGRGAAPLTPSGRLDGMIWVDDPTDRLLPNRRCAASAAGVRQPGDGRDRVRAPARAARAPGCPRPADRAAQPPRLQVRPSTCHLEDLGAAGDVSLLVIDLDHFKRINDSSATTPATRCCGATGGAARPRGTPTCRRGSAARSWRRPAGCRRGGRAGGRRARAPARPRRRRRASAARCGRGRGGDPRAGRATPAGSCGRPTGDLRGKRLGLDPASSTARAREADALRDAEGRGGAARRAAALFLAQTLDRATRERSTRRPAGSRRALARTRLPRAAGRARGRRASSTTSASSAPDVILKARPARRGERVDMSAIPSSARDAQHANPRDISRRVRAPQERATAAATRSSSRARTSRSPRASSPSSTPSRR